MSEQPFTNPTIGDELPPPPLPSAMRTAAWISLLVLGIFYVLGGSCLAVAMLFATAYFSAAGRAGMPGDTKMMMIVVAAGMLLLVWGVAATYIWTAFLVRRGSRGAALTSLAVSIFNAMVLLALVVIGVIAVLSEPAGTVDPGAIFGVLFYLLPVAANLWVAIALGRISRLKRVDMQGLGAE